MFVPLKKPNLRVVRANEVLKKALGEVLQDLWVPQKALLTYGLEPTTFQEMGLILDKVHLSKDLSLAKVFVFPPLASTPHTLGILEVSTPHIRASLTKKAKMRRLPDLKFFFSQISSL